MNFIQQDFLPGQNWLYLKIFCGPKAAEEILLKALYPKLQKWYAAGRFSKFFFIRYKETDSHLRIRFFNEESSKNFWLMESINSIISRYVETYMVSSIQIDTYQREMERYGSAILLAEDIFFFDSMATLSLLSRLEHDENDKQRLLAALISIDALLSGFNLDILSKHDFVRNRFEAFFKEFGATPVLNKQLNAKYKLFHSELYGYLSGTVAYPLKGIIEASTQAITNRMTQHSEELPPAFLPALIHMHVNRMFLAKQRLHELLVYHFLSRYYAARKAARQIQL